MINSATLDFLKGLEKNNNKPWFDAHRTAYESARDDYSAFIETVIGIFGKKEPSIAHLKAKDCLFRINRDVRFSKDKSPYKTNFGAYINGEGKKSVKAGYYIHLQPGQSFVGGGLWHPQPEHLNKVRQEIDYNLKDFKKIISSKKFTATYGGLARSEDFLLSRVPKGYEPDNPAAEYLKFKSFVAMGPVTDADIISKGFITQVCRAFETLKPLVDFINEGIG